MYSGQLILWLHDLCLEILTMHENELCLLLDKRLPFILYILFTNQTHQQWETFLTSLVMLWCGQRSPSRQQQAGKLLDTPPASMSHKWGILITISLTSKTFTFTQLIHTFLKKNNIHKREEIEEIRRINEHWKNIE